MLSKYDDLRILSIAPVANYADNKLSMYETAHTGGLLWPHIALIGTRYVNHTDRHDNKTANESGNCISSVRCARRRAQADTVGHKNTDFACDGF